MGVGTILRAKAILLVVSGKDKAAALNAVVNGPITPQVPGSVLRLHPNVIIVADEDALSGIKEISIKVFIIIDQISLISFEYFF